jgi:peroxiredoxin 6
LVLFSHPNDYTPVCTTELGEAALQQGEFDRRNVKLLGLSCNDAEDHDGWAKDIEVVRGKAPEFPIIADKPRTVAATLGMLDEDEMDAPGLPATVRKVFIVGPDHKTKVILAYPTAVGRNFVEILRIIDALQLAAKFPIATPVNWTPGNKVMVQPTCSDETATAKGLKFEKINVPSGKSYVRMAQDPSL